jgi:protein-S-isoprenylcysteine O-methyltransferase Ste14
VFLLVRIKEAFDAGAPLHEAVALGLERTGRLVTAAALLFCIAMGSFATSEIAFIKQLGLGTALAVLIDATIVRALLVPALMALLGERNWWAPRPAAAATQTTRSGGGNLMATLALIFVLVYFALAFGLRTVLQLRRTGSSGFRGVSGRPGSPEWLGGVLFAVSIVLVILAPVLQLAEVVGSWSELDTTATRAAGIVLALVGTVLTLAAQAAMGESWRIGIDERERTTLVTDGPFALVRNPVFAAMIPATLGLLLMVPNVVALAGLLALAGALQLQTRVVEEPYLLRTHGETYASYAASVGRFLPGIGRLNSRRR